MDTVAATAHETGVIAAACAAVGLSRATFHRRQAAVKRPPAPTNPRPKPARALAADERQGVLDLLREDRFAGQAPAEIYATLLDEGISGDLAAVRAALTEDWSNGEIEGQITKQKLVNRQIYDRAWLDLLRARLVVAS